MLRTIVIAAALSLNAGVSQAQTSLRTVALADSALAAGSLGLADSLYYAGARERPRDPIARAALGRYLASQGRVKVGVVLLEEARMFGGDPAFLARELVPLYEYLGDWRALLTLPSSPLSLAERRRAARLAEHPFAVTLDGGTAPIIGAAGGDTIARVAVRVGGRASVASIVGTDAGIAVGSRMAAGASRRFDGDSTIIVLDSLLVARSRLVNVPATIAGSGTTVAIGVAALAGTMVVVDYGRGVVRLAREESDRAHVRHRLIRDGGQLRVLDTTGWMTLAEFAMKAARARSVLVIDVAGGEARVGPPGAP